MVGNYVYEIRSKTKLTQDELAKKVQVSRQTIIAIEKGNYAPSIELALKISIVLKTRVERLFYLI